MRSSLLPYGRQTIGDEDIEAVAEVLRSDFLTTGPTIGRFEEAFAAAVGAEHAVAVSSGTAAIHAMVSSLGVGSGDEVVVPAITFAASANCVVYEGATPVFCDVSPDTLLIDPGDLQKRISPRTKAVMPVDFGGQPCNYEELRDVCDAAGVPLIVDAAHSLGGSYKGESIGTLGLMSAFSLHPVKAMTTGEGGMVTTGSETHAAEMRRFRNHGLDADHRERTLRGSWLYEMVELGYNYRLTDVGCALGLSQLKKVDSWIERRRSIAQRYDDAFASCEGVQPLARVAESEHAFHLYVVQFELERLTVDREGLFNALRAEGIGVNVHYLPVYLHPYYQSELRTRAGACPNAETAYERILSLPIFPTMTDSDVQDVVDAVIKVLAAYFR